MTAARRVLERHWTAWLALALVVGSGAAGAIAGGHVALGGVVLVALVGFLVAVGWSAPAARLRRMERQAQPGLPAADGPATIVGTVVASSASLVAPHSRRACVAYWERTAVAVDGGWATVAESVASVELVLRCGDALVVVHGAAATVLCDAARAVHVRGLGGVRMEEVTAQPGDPLVVSGRLVRGAADGPFRAVAAIERDGRAAVVIGLSGGRTRRAR